MSTWIKPLTGGVISITSTQLSISVPPLTFTPQFISTSFYKIAEHILCIEALDEWSAQFIAGFMRRFHFAPISPDGAGVIDYTIRISSNEPPHLPPYLETFEVQRGLCYTDWQSYYLCIDESLILVNAPPAKLTEVWIGESAHARHPVALANLMSYAMQAAMRRIGLYELHAAGLVEPTKGVGTLFIGDSNCGKSTLTVRLASEGWGYLSDDMLALSESRGEIEARGLRRNFAISPLVVEGWKLSRLKEALGGPIPSDPSKRHLDPSIMFPNGFIGFCVPKMLFFPLITNQAHSRIEKLSQSEAMIKLITSCAWARYDKTIARDYLQVLAALIRQSASWALYTGHDLIAEPGFANAFISKHMTE